MTRGRQVIVIGAGIGGLTAAALLVKAGCAVTVLESHIYPGGSAGTFYNRGYRFDAGATLAGGFSPGGPHARLAEALGIEWPVFPADPAWVVHLPDLSITQWNSPERWREERRRALPGSEPFWKAQERLARAAWDVSSRDFPWPPESLHDLAKLAAAVRPGLALAAPYALSSVASLIPSGASANLRPFLDAQLLISAQTTAKHANALYGSAALDLPRRGVNHVRGGIGGLAQALVSFIRANGGRVLYRQRVTGVRVANGRAAGVITTKGLDLSCDALVANLTPGALADLLPGRLPRAIQRKAGGRNTGWGAFTLYLGLEAAALPALVSDHHQVLVDPSKPLGEGNSVFISLSGAGDESRAPAGMRAATLSTHTAVAPWWVLASGDPAGYQRRREEYTRLVLSAAERAIPSIRDAARLCLPGTPVTFQFYTRRPLGQVGGYPQSSLLGAFGPRTGISNAWLVGDSIFPGQSTAATTLGGWRVAAEVLRSLGEAAG